MKTEVFNGNQFAKEILDSLKKEVVTLKEPLSLSLVSFGETSSPYIKKKKEVASHLGIDFKNYYFKETISTRAFRVHLNKIVKTRKGSVIVQLPLPAQINTSVLDVIPPDRDPDLLSGRSVGMFFSGKEKVEPPTAKAIIMILESKEENLKGKAVTVFGHGKLVGRFLPSMLLERGANVKISANSMKDKDLEEFAQSSDIVISSVGKPHFLNPSLLPKDTIVIDAGFSTLDGNILGDVDFEARPSRFKFISPVPGGVGPVGVALVFKNIIELAK